ncbi:MAG TPA: hypothetical protein VGJ86_10755 [Acidimicrobiales bacterium]|jgi:hypothetical protein
MGISSANPQQLETAAKAVAQDTHTQLVNAYAGLIEKIGQFNRATQQPELLKVPLETHSGGYSTALNTGADIDVFLLRVAAAFRAAGGDGRPPGFVGPIVPTPIRFLDDSALGAQLDAWNRNEPLTFRQTSDGKYEVHGPDGNWYRMVDVPPFGAPALSQTEQTTDFGNPDFGLIMAAHITIGLTRGRTQLMDRAAPPSAYNFIHFDENGYPLAGPEAAGQSQPPRLPPPSGAGTSAANGIGMVQGALAEASKGMDARYANVYRTQTTFYVDPHSGQRVAVVDAANIRYDNGSNDALVTSGRLSVDSRGRPVLVPRRDPQDPNECIDDSGPSIGPATTIRIPAEEGE